MVAGASVAHRTVISAERNVILCVSDGAAPAMLPPSMHSLQPRSSSQHHLHARGSRPDVVVLAAWPCPWCQGGAANTRGGGDAERVRAGRTGASPEVAFCLFGIAPCREQGVGGGSPRVVLQPFPLGGSGWLALFGKLEGTAAAESAGPAGGQSRHRT